MKVKQLILIICFLVFLGTGVWVFWPRPAGEEYQLPDFKNNLTSELEGWQWEDRPIAESEELIEVIGDQLAFDEGLYRIYWTQDISVAVWAAYWSPGKMDIRDVQWHIPDSCWVHSGWQIDQRQDDLHFDLGEKGKLISGEYRLMEKAGRKMHIGFWHLVGGKGLKLTRGAGSVVIYPEIIVQTGFQSRAEQYFFRISSTHPLEDLTSDPGFRSILESLGELGLYAE